MEREWTDEQINAINVKGRAAIVSAAAGSGKTSVLVEKLLRLLTDKDDYIPADRIAVVTFTNDAAAQMKQRLMTELSEALENDSENELLLSQQAMIPSAKISTIHSFCFGLIRENSGLLDVDPAFRVLDPAESEVVSAKAIECALDGWFRDKSSELRRLTNFFCPGKDSENALTDMLSSLRSSLLALPFPRDKMDDITEGYAGLGDIRKDPMVKRYAGFAAKKLRNAAARLDECISEIKDVYGSDADTVSKISKTCEGLEAYRENVSKAVKELDKDPFAMISPSFEVKADSVTLHKKGYDEDAIEKAKKKYNKCRSIFASYWGKYTEDDIRADFTVHAEICGLLFGLMRDILDNEKRIKREMNALSFSDAEQLACELLCEKNDREYLKTPLAKELSEHYRIVMIDEFQDSTAVQELIFKMISKDGSAETPGTNFFAVGDVKQSIYRFRCADPSLFLSNLKNSVPYAEDGSSAPAKILLNKNFRSAENVVNFVNTVFCSIMSSDCGGIDYGEEDTLRYGAKITDCCEPTELIILPAGDSAEDIADDDDDDSSAEDRVTSTDIIEAECTAARISELLQGSIKDGDGTRKILPKDICILMRNGKKADIFRESLGKLGISAQCPAEESYLSSREVSVLISLLRCINNPSLDIHMAAVLMSPMFMFTAEDMARLRIHSGSPVYKNIISCGRYGEEHDFDGALINKCAKFLECFGELRKFAASHTIEQLINRIYDRTDFMASVSAYKDSLKKKANLRLLPLYAADYDKNGMGGLDGFLRRIDSMIRAGKDFTSASAAVSAGDAVRIGTIHGAKGLEYPFVFLCGTWTKFNMTDVRGSTVFTSEANFGTAFRISIPEKMTRYESFPRETVSMILEKNTRDEEMMLLYVALTRAKNRLFITRRSDEAALRHRENILALLDKTAKKQDAAVSAGCCMADWLDAALGLFKKDGNELKLGNCRVITREGKPAESGGSADTDRKADVSSDIAEEFRRNMEFDYDFAPSRTASKLSVSDILRRHDMHNHAPFPNKKPSHRPAGVSAAEAGTAVHEFMEHADFRRLAEGDKSRRSGLITEEKEKLLSMGFITKVQAECVSEELVSLFLDDGICGRMLRSPELMRERKFLIKISDMDLATSEISLDDFDFSVYNDTEGMLQGIADCIFREDDGYVLVDYKTNSNVTDEILRDNYSIQLSLYAAALSQILGAPVREKYIYSFDLGHSIKID